MGNKARPVPVEGRHVGTPRERRPMREMTDAKVYTSERVCMCVCVCVHAKSLRSCQTLCDPMDHSPPVSSFLGILQPRILEWDATPSSRGSSRPRDRTQVSYSAGRFFTADPPEKSKFIST